MRKYYRIGEISRLYHIGVDSLRYYEELGLIHPRRSEGGYRMYSVDEIWRLNVIRELRELDFPMERIGAYLNHHTVDTTLGMLQEEQAMLEEKLRSLQKTRENVERRRSLLETARKRPLETITAEVCPPRRYFSIPEGYAEEHEMDVLIKRLLNMDPEHFYVIGSNQIGTLIARPGAAEQRLRYRAVFLMDENGGEELPGGTYLTVSYQGDYRKSDVWVRRLLDYAREQGWKPVGDILEILWIDIHTSEETSEHITELQLRVEAL